MACPRRISVSPVTAEGEAERGEFLDIFRIHGFRAAANGFDGDAEVRRKFLEEVICAGQVVRDPAGRFVDDVPRRADERRQGIAGIQVPVFGADERLGEIDGILHGRDDGEEIAVADEIFGKRGLVAAREPVAAEPALFQIRGGDLELVAFPFPDGETVPGLGGVGRWLGPVVHIDRARRAVGKGFDVPGKHGIGERIKLRPDAQAAGSARGVVGRVRLALVLLLVPLFGGPAVGAEARGVVDGQAGVIADEGVGGVVGAGGLRVGAGEIDLGAGRLGQERRREKGERREKQCPTSGPHDSPTSDEANRGDSISQAPGGKQRNPEFTAETAEKTQETGEPSCLRLKNAGPVVDFQHGKEKEEQEKTQESKEGRAQEKGGEPEGCRAESRRDAKSRQAPAHERQTRRDSARGV